MNFVYAIAVINYSYIGMVLTRTLQILYCASPYNSTQSALTVTKLSFP